MNVKEYNEADRDVEVLCLANHRRRRESDERMTEELYRSVAASCDVELMEGNTESADRMIKNLKHVFFTCARLVPGMVFLGAVPRGWMDPAFAVVCALGCFISALVYYRRGYRHE